MEKLATGELIKQIYISGISRMLTDTEEAVVDYIIDNYLNRLYLLKVLGAKNTCFEKGYKLSSDKYISSKLNSGVFNDDSVVDMLFDMNSRLISKGAYPKQNLLKIHIDSQKSKLKNKILLGAAEYLNNFDVNCYRPEVFDIADNDNYFSAHSVSVVSKNQLMSLKKADKGDVIFMAEVDVQRVPYLSRSEEECYLINLMKKLSETGLVKYLTSTRGNDLTEFIYECFLSGKGISINRLNRDSLRLKLVVISDIENKKCAKSYMEKTGLNVTNIGDIINNDEVYCFDQVKAITVKSKILRKIILSEFKKRKIENLELRPSGKLNLGGDLNINNDVTSRLQFIADSVIDNVKDSLVKDRYKYFDTMSDIGNISQVESDEAKVTSFGNHSRLLVSSHETNIGLEKYDIREQLKITFAKCIHKVVCSGGIPLSTDISMPELINQDNMVLLSTLKELCSAYGIKLSSYNKHNSGEYRSHLSVSVCGVIDNKEYCVSSCFKEKGDMIFLIGKCKGDLSSSVLTKILKYEDLYKGINTEDDSNVLKSVQLLIRRRLLNSANFISSGGLFLSLLRASFKNRLAFDITTSSDLCKNLFLFSEDPSRLVVTVSPINEVKFIDFMIKQKVPFLTLGHVTKGELRVDDESLGFISDYARRINTV